MSYTASDKLPETFFVDTLTEKAEMMKKHLKDTHSKLVTCGNTGPNMATFKFFNPQEEDSLKLCYTFSNLSDLKGPTVSIVGSVELYFKRKLDIACMYVINFEMTYMYIYTNIC